MLAELRSFASDLTSNGMYELGLSMVKHIREEFQSVFGVTFAYEPEYEQIMGDLQNSIKDVEAAIAAAGPRPSSNQLMSPSVTPLTRRRTYIPQPQSSLRPSTRTHARGSSPSPYRPRSRSQTPPPSSPISSGSKSRPPTPPTPSKPSSIPPPPQFSHPSPLPPAAHTPLPKKRKRMMAFVELTPWEVKKRRTLTRGQPHAPKKLNASFGDHTRSPLLGVRERLHTRSNFYPPDRPVRVVGKERHSSADTASSCSPTSSRTRLIASRRHNRAPSPSPVPSDDESVQVCETSEESGDSEAEECESDYDEEDGEDLVEMSLALPTSDDPLNLLALPDSSPRIRFGYNKKSRLRPPPRSRHANSP